MRLFVRAFHCPKTKHSCKFDERPDYTVVTAATDFHRTSLSFKLPNIFLILTHITSNVNTGGIISVYNFLM